MNQYLKTGWILALLVSGCASSPPSSTTNMTTPVIPEKTLATVSDTDENVLILRQPGASKSGTGQKSSKPGAHNKPGTDASVASCPPGQLMATRIISGETGTRISEECVTPFSSKGRRFQSKKPVAVKVRTVDGRLKTEKIITK